MPEPARPFGTDAPRSRAPLYLYAVLLAIWFVFLVLMAAN